MTRRGFAALMALAMFAAACSSSDDDTASTDGTSASSGDAEGEGSDDPGSQSTDASAATTDTVAAIEPGNQVGITDTEINFSMIYGDLQPIIDAGLVPDLPSYVDVVNFFLDRASEEGTLGGRTASVTFHPFPSGSTPGDQLAACIEATEDRENFIVLFGGGSAEETVLCVTNQHETIALMGADAQTDTLFEQSDGRLFNNAMAIGRLTEVAIDAYDEQGRLDGATIGIVRADDAAAAEVAANITDNLEEHGYAVAQDVALPCEQNSCTNIDGAVEALRAAGVDTVFSLLGVLAYPEFVQAAGRAGLVPRYFSSDYENQVFDTTARFMQSASEWYDGAIGTSSSLIQNEPDEYRAECNEAYSAATGEEWEPLSDGWFLVGNMCELVDRIGRVLTNIEADGLEVGQDTFIAYMERETVDNGDRRGAFGPDKHDAYDRYVQLEYVADCRPDDPDGITGCWREVEGTRAEWQD